MKQIRLPLARNIDLVRLPDMRMAMILCLLVAGGILNARATPEDEARKAITDLLDQPNYRWVRTEEWAKEPPMPAFTATTVGRTDHNGLTVATITLEAPGFPSDLAYRTITGAFDHGRAAATFGRGWFTAEELLRELRPDSHWHSLPEQEKRSALTIMNWTYGVVRSGDRLPNALLSTILKDSESFSTVGGSIAVTLTSSGARSVLQNAQWYFWLHDMPDSHLEDSTTCLVRVWIGEGHLTKLEAHAVGSFAPIDTRTVRAPRRELDATVTIVFSDPGKAEFNVPKEARAKLDATQTSVDGPMK